MKNNVVMVAFIASLGGLLFGYDTAVISGGIDFLAQYFDLNDAAKGLAVSSALIGCTAGALLSGLVGRILGRKKTLQMAALLYIVSAIGSALPKDFTTFIIFRIIGGLGIGLSSVVPVYIAEIAPAKIRGALNSLYQLSITLGILIVYLSNFLINKNSPGPEWDLQMSWRWMLGSETVPAVMFFLLLFIIPESPRWLVQNGREKAAAEIFRRLNIHHVEEQIKAIHDGLHGNIAKKFSFNELLSYKKVLFIAISLAILQQFVGINVIIYYATTLFAKISPNSNPFVATVLIGSVNFLSTFIAVRYVDSWGRQKMLKYGALLALVSMMLLGICIFFQITGAWMIVLVLLYIVAFACSLGPIVWLYIPEISPTQIRATVAAVAIGMLWLANITVSQTFPMLNGSKLLADVFNGAAPFFFYSIFALLFFLLACKIPETKNKTLEQISAELG